MSETSKHREKFLEYVQGNGIDIGYGGDPIVDSAMTVDMPKKYSSVGNKPQHLHGDATDLYWFADNVLNYVYSSHCIEDFEDTGSVLREWLRVIKKGGFLCILFPDEQVYRGKTSLRNIAHVHDNFGMEFVKKLLSDLDVKIIVEEECFDGDDYNCILILEKL